MRDFDAPEARQGAPVINALGQAVRLLVFNAKTRSGHRIIGLALDEDRNEETIHKYTVNGEASDSVDHQLFMKPTQHTGWTNIYAGLKLGAIWDTEEEAVSGSDPTLIVLDTIQVEWED